MNDKKSGGGIGPIIVIILFIVLAFSTCSSSGSSKNSAYDPNGFLGYSDDFWDWYVDHN